MEPQLIVGVSRIQVKSGDEANINVQCDVPFKARYLAIPRSISRSFEIVDIKVCRISQLHSKSAIPADAFAGDVELIDASENEQDFLKKTHLDQPMPLEIDSCPSHEFITIVVRNIGPCAENFSAVLFGTPHQPRPVNSL